MYLQTFHYYLLQTVHCGVSETGHEGAAEAMAPWSHLYGSLLTCPHPFVSRFTLGCKLAGRQLLKNNAQRGLELLEAQTQEKQWNECLVKLKPRWLYEVNQWRIMVSLFLGLKWLFKPRQISKCFTKKKSGVSRTAEMHDLLRKGERRVSSILASRYMHTSHKHTSWIYTWRLYLSGLPTPAFT